MKTALVETSLVFLAFGDGSPLSIGSSVKSHTDYWLLRVPEFLDCRTHKAVLLSD